ncbi:MAG: Cof-type HAD-IIB family hydrolase [Bacilli bacterium]
MEAGRQTDVLPSFLIGGLLQVTHYQMLATDLDDTLLRDDGTISQETVNAFHTAQAQGARFVLASGRPKHAMQHLVAQLKLDVYRSFIITFNGGEIIDCHTGETIYTNHLSPEELHNVYDLSQQHGTFFHTYVDDAIVTDRRNPYSEKSHTLTGMPLVVEAAFKETYSVPAPKVILSDEPDKIVALRDALLTTHGETFEFFRSKPMFLEVTRKGVNKGAAITWLAHRLDIPLSEVICCGDSDNDISMLKIAGLGVSVANGNDEAKAAANAQTTSNNDDGVRRVIEQYLY